MKFEDHLLLRYILKIYFSVNRTKFYIAEAIQNAFCLTDKTGSLESRISFRGVVLFAPCTVDIHFKTINKMHNVLLYTHIYRCGPVFAGNTFQDLPRLREIADNTERYI
jgi:predicted nucleotidyltransferase